MVNRQVRVALPGKVQHRLISLAISWSLNDRYLQALDVADRVSELHLHAKLRGNGIGRPVLVHRLWFGALVGRRHEDVV